mgnify:CR=1 FL=1
MARLSRVLSHWLTYAFIGYLALVLAFGLQSRHSASQERKLVIAFVCDSIQIRLEQDGPGADEFVARFAVIMRKYDAHCSPPVRGLP